MKKLIKENIKVDAIITDPPYNLSKKNNFHTMARAGLDFGEWDNNFDQISWLHYIDNILNKDGSVVIFNAFENIPKIQNVLKNYNFVFKDLIIWEKSNPMPKNRDRRYVNASEYAIFMTRKGAKWTFNKQSNKYDRNIIKCSIVAGKEKTKHTTQKPLKLIMDLVARHTNKNDLVADLFMGSGTTGVACKNLHRNFIGVEKDETYFKIAENRILGA
jgi:DNA modification methylase